MIPRIFVAEALGLPSDTDALPKGDLPCDRFAARLIAYLSSGDSTAEAADAWTGTVMDRLIATEPDLALDILVAGAGMTDAGVLADPLAELALAGHAGAIAERAGDDAGLAALVDVANAA